MQVFLNMAAPARLESEGSLDRMGLIKDSMLKHAKIVVDWANMGILDDIAGSPFLGSIPGLPGSIRVKAVNVGDASIYALRMTKTLSGPLQVDGIDTNGIELRVGTVKDRTGSTHLRNISIGKGEDRVLLFFEGDQVQIRRARGSEIASGAVDIDFLALHEQELRGIISHFKDVLKVEASRRKGSASLVGQGAVRLAEIASAATGTAGVRAIIYEMSNLPPAQAAERYFSDEAGSSANEAAKANIPPAEGLMQGCDPHFSRGGETLGEIYSAYIRDHGITEPKDWIDLQQLFIDSNKGYGWGYLLPEGTRINIPCWDPTTSASNTAESASDTVGGLVDGSGDDGSNPNTGIPGETAQINLSSPPGERLNQWSEETIDSLVNVYQDAPYTDDKTGILNPTNNQIGWYVGVLESDDGWYKISNDSPPQGGTGQYIPKSLLKPEKWSNDATRRIVGGRLRVPTFVYSQEEISGKQSIGSLQAGSVVTIIAEESRYGWKKIIGIGTDGNTLEGLIPSSASYTFATGGGDPNATVEAEPTPPPWATLPPPTVTPPPPPTEPPPTEIPAPQFSTLQVEGSRFMENGQEVILRGATAPHFAWNIPMEHNKFFSNVKTLHDWGANFVIIDWNSKFIDNTSYIESLVRAAEYAHSLGMKVELSLHSRGLTNPNDGYSMNMIHDLDEQVVSDWKNLLKNPTIAARLASSVDIFGILAEPVPDSINDENWNKACDAIKQIIGYQDSLCSISPPEFGSKLHELMGTTPQQGRNLIEFRAYHDTSKAWGTIEKMLKLRALGYNLFVGEMGWQDDLGYVKELVEIFNANGISYSFWDLDTGNEASIFDYDSNPTPLGQILKDALEGKLYP